MKKPDKKSVTFHVDKGSCHQTLVASLLSEGYDMEGILDSLKECTRDGTLTYGDKDDWYVVTEWMPHTASTLSGGDRENPESQIWDLVLENGNVATYRIYREGSFTYWDWERIDGVPTGAQEDIAMYDSDSLVTFLVRRHSTPTYRPGAFRRQ